MMAPLFSCIWWDRSSVTREPRQNQRRSEKTTRTPKQMDVTTEYYHIRLHYNHRITGVHFLQNTCTRQPLPLPNPPQLMKYPRSKSSIIPFPLLSYCTVLITPSSCLCPSNSTASPSCKGAMSCSLNRVWMPLLVLPSSFDLMDSSCSSFD
jgi:hypothetical protein